ncbi:MAG TPA: hypothetical protein VLR26_08690 [Frankiaceae bacterium]|nr:hypothetical protein [Frankiaceae bacterium]
MIARIVVALYFLIGILVAINHGYLDGGIAFTADGLWKLANFALGAGFWPLIVITPYDFKLPHAILKQG